MQEIDPLTTDDFKNASAIVIKKIEVDIDGEGDFRELPDLKDFTIDTNIEDAVSRFCAYSFLIICLNTDKRYFSWNTASPQHNWLKQGRRIKIWAGIQKDSEPYLYQWIIGRVDNYLLATVAGEEICTITGRDFMRIVLDYKLYSPYTYWGSIQTFNTKDGIANYALSATVTGTDIAFVDGGAGEDQITRTAADFVSAGFIVGNVFTVSGSASNDGSYTIISVTTDTINVATGSLEVEAVGASVTITWDTGCTGLYIAYLDSIDPYDGSHLTPIYDGFDFGYVGATNKFSFLADKIPNYAGIDPGNLKVYYYQAQSIENVVGDILIGSGILQAKIEEITISFSDSNPDTILDSNNGFVIAGFRSGQIITVNTTSEENDGTYTISTVTPGVITLIASDSLTMEDAATAGTVTITTDTNLVSKADWINNVVGNYVTPTGIEIDRVSFNTGTSAFEAIRLLAEVAQYRFYFDYSGNPIFKAKPSIGASVDTFSDDCIENQEAGENVEEVYNHIIVVGESRETLG